MDVPLPDGKDRVVHTLRRTATWIVVLAAWSCGAFASVDSGPGSDVASVDVAPLSLSLIVGKETSLQATVRDGSGRPLSEVPVVWSVRDTAIARVTSSGVVSALGVGSTQVAASANGVSAIASLVVQPPPVASVAVQPLTQSLVVGQSATFTATPRDAGGATLGDRVVTWTSGDTGVATVSQDGVVAAHAVGTVTITAASEGVSGSATVSVSAAPVATVSVDPATSTLMRGATVQLVATLKDANGTALTDRIVAWTSSDNTIAIVSTAGVVTGVAPGVATITATSEGKSATASVTVVKPPLASITVLPDTVTVQVGGTVTLTATLKDVTGAVVVDRTVAWTSSNTAVATVSTRGVVTALAPGVATMTAVSEGKSGSAGVTVKKAQPAVASVAVSPPVSFLKKGGSVRLSATAYDASRNPISGRSVTWSSSDDHIATVDASGVVTAKRSGTVTISATVDDKVGTTTVVVTS